MALQEFLWPIRVYVEDTDAGGIVYYVNYLKFMERARTELLRSLGYGKAGANRESYQFVVHSVDIRYKQPAHLDDELAVTAQVTKCAGSSVCFSQAIWREDVLLSEAKIKIACVDGATLKPMPIPIELGLDLKLSLESN